ncbi:MAG: alpha/beta hydrolase [Thermoanaerobaculia bacterium]
MPNAAFVLLAALASAPSQSPVPTPVPPPRSDPATATAVLKVPGMDRVRIVADAVYSRPDGTPLAADVYLPAAGRTGARAPVVILVAGGAENPKAWGIYTSLGRLLAASGLAAVPFNHRLRYPKRQYEEGAADLLAVIGYLRSNAARLGIDADRIAVTAFSGGGPMLSVAMRQRPAGVRALAGIYAFLDTGHVNAQEAGTTPEVIRRFSPLEQLTAGPGLTHPLFVARAGRDEIPGVNESIDGFAAAALERNAPLTLVNHPTGFHGFEHRNDDERSREILRMWIEFLRMHLR